jgi:hypothetical protein
VKCQINIALAEEKYELNPPYVSSQNIEFEFIKIAHKATIRTIVFSARGGFDTPSLHLKTSPS